MRKSLERALTALLSVTIIGFVSLIIYRECYSVSTTISVSPPTYLPGWESLPASGLQIDSGDRLTIVEFVDVQCPSCRIQHDELVRFRKQFAGRVALTFVHFPLSTHPYARAGAIALECAHRGGFADEYATALFAKQDSIGLRSWDDFRRDAAGGDSLGFSKCMTDPTAEAQVEIGRQAGRKFGVSGTPTVIVDGWRYEGAVSYKELSDFLDRQNRGLLPRGATLPSPEVHTAQADTSIPGTLTQFTVADLERAPMFTTGVVPTAELDGDAADFGLSGVNSAVVLSDGRMITYDLFRARLLVFDPTGKLLRQLGRRGAGPKEFGSVMNIAATLGDSVLLLDRGNERLYWATAEAGVVRSRRLPTGLPRRMARVAGGFRSDEGIVFFEAGQNASPRKERKEVIDSIGVFLLALDGTVKPITSVADAKLVPAQSSIGGRQSVGFEPVRLSGRAHVNVWNSRVVTAAGDELKLLFWDSNGKPSGGFQVNRPRRPVTSAVRQSLIDIELEALRQPSAEKPIDLIESERRIRSAPFADSLPAIWSVHVAPNDLLWVVDGMATSDTGWSATAFRLNGTIAGRLSSSVPGFPIAFGKDRVAVRNVDADGVVAVKLYPIMRRRNQ